MDISVFRWSRSLVSGFSFREEVFYFEFRVVVVFEIIWFEFVGLGFRKGLGRGVRLERFLFRG